MGKTVLITGINSYFAFTLLPMLDTDPDIDKIIGIDVTPWKGGFHKVDFYKTDIPLGLDEKYPMTPNPDSYYNSSKVEAEEFVSKFFKNHPEITSTVLRVGMLCGPNIRSMFSKLWSMKISALPMGSNAVLQLIHEEDLGVYE